MRNWTDQEIEEKIGTLFYPDTIAAPEYFEGLSPKTSLDPTKKLMLAIVEDALKCFLANVSAHGGKNKKLFDEAEQWIMAEESDEIFSFATICEVLGLNPQYVRRRLMRWKEQKAFVRARPKTAANQHLAA
jgi:hypothetical protein